MRVVVVEVVVRSTNFSPFRMSSDYHSDSEDFQLIVSDSSPSTLPRTPWFDDETSSSDESRAEEPFLVYDDDLSA